MPADRTLTDEEVRRSLGAQGVPAALIERHIEYQRRAGQTTRPPGGRRTAARAPASQPIDRTVQLAPLFYALLEKYQIPRPVPELRFSTARQWRFDWAWPAYLVALEVEGGAWSNGRHVRGKGFLDDCAKYSEAAALGWRLIRVPPDQLCTLETVHLIKRALAVTSDYGPTRAP